MSVTSVAILGLEAEPINVEADMVGNLPAFNIVGLPDTTVKESKERVRFALRNSGFGFPRGHVAVNLAPADIRKQGPMHDLAMALALLVSQKEIPAEALKDGVFIGELGMNGEIRGVHGALIAAIMAKERGYKKLFAPKENVDEALLINGIGVIPVEHLCQVVEHLCGGEQIALAVRQEQPLFTNHAGLDFADIRGQEHAKRGLEVAASGGHNLIMRGPPGSGKTLMARALPSILPTLTQEEAMEVTKIYSITGALQEGQGLFTHRPFRNPHHSCSAAALIGGGSWPKPGEVSLAHRGILFLDEFPEFSRHVLEHLRQPIEDGVVTIARALASFRFPAKFMLVAAMNPCPCGYADNPRRRCTCPLSRISAYKKKISGPLLDRLDLSINVPRVETEKLTNLIIGETSETIRARVQNARNHQIQRFAGLGMVANSEMSPKMICDFCPLDEEGKKLVSLAMEKWNLSARAYTRILKLARTVADLENEKKILPSHLSEALSYRGWEEGI